MSPRIPEVKEDFIKPAYEPLEEEVNYIADESFDATLTDVVEAGEFMDNVIQAYQNANPSWVDIEPNTNNPMVEYDPRFTRAIAEGQAMWSAVIHVSPQVTRRGAAMLFRAVVMNNWTLGLIVLCLCFCIGGCDIVPGVYEKELASVETWRAHRESLGRVKREGFGPSEVFVEENNAIWQTVNTTKEWIIKEKEIVLEAVHTVIDAVEHPIRSLSRSVTGIAFMVFCSLVVLYVTIVFLVKIYPAARFLAIGCIKIIVWPFQAMYRCGCCVTCVTWAPIARWRLRRQISKEDAAIPLIKPAIYNGYEKVVSSLYYDENGPYLLNGKTRVYFSKTEDVIQTTIVNESNRIRADTNKESLVAKSVPKVVEKLPEFQGQFKVDNTVIGHFSRIRWNGMDCILTAYHVLEYNRASIISLCKDDREVAMHSVRLRVVAWSNDRELDFILLQVPMELFSKLQLKQGKIATRLNQSSPVAIYQMDGEKKVVTSAIVRPSIKPWHIEYAASTFVGSSGSPVLDLHHNIVGVHIESNTVSNVNVGVIPPFFRNKESLMNNDVIERYDMIDISEQYDEIFDRKHGTLYNVIDYEEDFSLDKKYDWAAQVDELDAVTGRQQATNAKIRRYLTTLSQSGKGMKMGVGFDEYDYAGEYMGEQRSFDPNEDHYSKESPWTCTKCGLLHLKAKYNCCSCGAPLIKCKTDESVVKAHKEEAETAASIDANRMVEYVDAVVGQQTAKFGEMITKALKGVVYRDDLKDLPDFVRITSDLKEALNRNGQAVKIRDDGKISMHKLKGDQLIQQVAEESKNVKVEVVKIDNGKKKKRARKNKLRAGDVAKQTTQVSTFAKPSSIPIAVRYKQEEQRKNVKETKVVNHCQPILERSVSIQEWTTPVPLN